MGVLFTEEERTLTTQSTQKTEQNSVPVSLKDLQHKTMIFVDGDNILCTGNELGWRIEWKKFFPFIQVRFPGSIIHAGYYYSHPKDRPHPQEHNGNGKNGNKMFHRDSFEDMLRRSGFSHIISEEQHLVDDGNGGKRMRGSNDVTIATDMLVWALAVHPQYKTAILMSSDSDFTPTVCAMRRHNPNARIICVGSRNNMKKNYHEVFHQIVHIENFKKELALEQETRPSTK